MEIAGRHPSLEARRREQELATIPLVDTGGADIRDGQLPSIDHLAVEAGIRSRRRDFEHRWTFPEISEGRDVGRRRVGRDRFKPGRGRSRICDDVVILEAQIVKRCTSKAVDRRGRNCPEHCLKSAMIFELVGEIIGGGLQPRWGLSSSGSWPS